MKIVVLVKEVPDTYGDRKIHQETGLADRSASDAVLDEINERALEVALSYADQHPDTSVTLLTLSPDSAQASLRRGLAMGADSAVHLSDPEFIGADLALTAEALASALKDMEYDLILAGNTSTDGASGLLPYMLAERLNIPAATALSEVTLGESELHARRVTEHGTEALTAALPALASVTEALPAARFPNFKGIMAAKKKPIITRSAADIGVTVDPNLVARSIMLSISERPKRSAGVRIVDTGDAAQQLADYLHQNHLA